MIFIYTLILLGYFSIPSDTRNQFSVPQASFWLRCWESYIFSYWQAHLQRKKFTAWVRRLPVLLLLLAHVTYSTFISSHSSRFQAFIYGANFSTTLISCPVDSNITQRLTIANYAERLIPNKLSLNNWLSLPPLALSLSSHLFNIWHKRCKRATYQVKIQ